MKLLRNCVIGDACARRFLSDIFHLSAAQRKAGELVGAAQHAPLIVCPLEVPNLFNGGEATPLLSACGHRYTRPRDRGRAWRTRAAILTTMPSPPRPRRMLDDGRPKPKTPFRLGDGNDRI